MSLALRVGALPLHAGFGVSALAGLGRLPQVADFLPKLASQTARIASRLQELKELVADGVPFAFDNGAILRAAPKKRPSHRRTREKLYAPGRKQIQPLENLVRCPACGHVKRSHFMCMHCFAEIRTFLKAKKRLLFGEPARPQQDLDAVDERIIYPGKYVRDREMRMKKRDWIPQREDTMMHDKGHLRKTKF